jgi:hypothetical protein
MKIAINDSIGDFSLSRKALECLGITDEKKLKRDFINPEDLGYARDEFENGVRKSEVLMRSDKRLIECLEKLGEEAYGKFTSKLKIIEIPDDVEVYIYGSEEGYESVHENHRVWS